MDSMQKLVNNIVSEARTMVEQKQSDQVRAVSMKIGVKQNFFKVGKKCSQIRGRIIPKKASISPFTAKMERLLTLLSWQEDILVSVRESSIL